MATLYETLRADIITAMKARDRDTATILRTADAAAQRAAMDAGKDVDDEFLLASLRKAVKNLKAANEEFAKGGRQDLIDANLAEIIILERYLPQAIEGDKLIAIVDAAVATTGAQTRREMGKVMAELKAHPQADLINFGEASKLIQQRLG